MDRSTFTEVVMPLLGEEMLPVIDWMKKKKKKKSLIRGDLKCPSRSTFVNWTKRSASLDLWKCQEKNCLQYKRNVSLKKTPFC